MSANANNAESLSPQKAAEEIRRIEGLHGALRQRASGLTWMIWGIVAPSIFVSYGLLGMLVGTFHFLRLLFPLLWIPWAAVGIIATATLWRSVSLVLPVQTARVREGILTGVLIVGLIFAGFGAISVTGLSIAPLAWVLLALGVALVIVGLLGFNVNSASERRLWVLGGLLLVVTSLVGTLLLGGDALFASQVFTFVSPLASALVFFGGGLYLTTRS